MREAVEESVTSKVMAAEVVSWVGVPEITPEALSRIKPGASVPLPIDHRYGTVPPIATSVAVYVTPTCPFGKAVVLMASGAGEMFMLSLRELVCAGLPESLT